MSTLKKNIILNGINTITGIIFPVITFPYAARVLLPEGIGTINFLNSIIGYIVLFTTLGIPIYGIKKIAQCGNDRRERDKTAIEIISLNLILGIVGYLIVWVLANYIPKIHERALLFYILSFSIFFTIIGVNWFYQGIEDFKFITVRSILIRCLSAVSLFVFVKDETDLVAYCVILVSSTVGNNIINIVHLRKYIVIKDFLGKELDIKRHLYPILTTSAIILIINLYYNITPLFIGFLSNDTQVGFFTAGNKITYIGTMIVVSITGALLPHCSKLLAAGDEKGFKDIINKSLNLFSFLSYPLVIVTMVLAKPIIMIFCGDDYDESIMVLLIVAPVMFFGVMSNFFVNQIYYPLDKIRIIIISVTIGAIFNIISNVVLIPQMGASGGAIAMLLGEFSVFTTLLICGKKVLPFKIGKIFPIRYFFISCVMGILIIIVTSSFQNNIIKLLIGTVIGFLFYIGVLMLLKDRSIRNYLLPLIRKS